MALKRARAALQVGTANHGGAVVNLNPYQYSKTELLLMHSPASRPYRYCMVTVPVIVLIVAAARLVVLSQTPAPLVTLKIQTAFNLYLAPRAAVWAALVAGVGLLLSFSMSPILRRIAVAITLVAVVLLCISLSHID